MMRTFQRRLLPSLLVALWGVGCVQTEGRGPDLGPCAVTPDGAYRFGEAGIGTCLSGPNDLQFVERDGAPWLAVTNADPFFSFSGGSVLMIDWTDVEAAVGQPREAILTNDLDTVVVNTDRFVAGMALVEERDQLLVASRLTADGRTRAGEDTAFVIDVSEGTIDADEAAIPLKDDPGDIVYDASQRLAYALNFTDHSISVLDVSDGPVLPIDLVGDASIEKLPFDDVDASGSVVELDRLAVLEPSLVPTDRWDLVFIDGTVRLYEPEGTGLSLSTSGGGVYVPDGNELTVDLGNAQFGPQAVEDAFVVSDLIGQNASATVGSAITYSWGGQLYTAVNESTSSSSGTNDTWTFSATPLYVGQEWDAWASGPSRTDIADIPAIVYAGAADEDADSSIGIALLAETGAFRGMVEPLLPAPAGESYEHPYAQIDARTFTTRVWFSHFNGDRYVIDHVELDDRGVRIGDELTAGVVETVLDLSDQSVAAPVVRRFAGQYRLWAARDDGDQWTYVTATSSDGVNWSALEDLWPAQVAYDSRKPPRLAIEHDESATWRLEGTDRGVSSTPAVTGTRVVDLQTGVTFTVAGGQQFPAVDDFLFDRAAGGIEVSSAVPFEGRTRLYVTTTGADGRDRIALVEKSGDTYDVIAGELIRPNTGGNVAGASKPLVFRPDPAGPFIMYYAAESADESRSIRVATSFDGLDWMPFGTDLIPPREGFDTRFQHPHSVEVTETGLRLWFGGFDGSRWRIGAADITDLDPRLPHLGVYTPVEDGPRAFLFGPGFAGGADDGGVRDPMVFERDGVRQMLYAGFDGSRWNLCHAVDEGTGFKRRLERSTEATLPAASGTSGVFDVGGLTSPVITDTGEVFYTGLDTLDSDSIGRLGLATLRGATVHPSYRLPTSGDITAFRTTRGNEATSVIELAQQVATFSVRGIGTTSLIHDEERGMLYVPSKLTNLLHIVDVRPDVTLDRADSNAFDLETVVSFDTIAGNAGFRGGVIDAARDRLYLTTRVPDGIAVLDLNAIVDNDEKEVTRGAFVHTLSLQDDVQDRGASSVATIGGGQPALAGDLLIVPNFNDNSVSVFDMSLGPYGQEIAYVPWVGENPHTVTISPDGRWAVIANYLGDVDENVAHSTLALLDIDPSSPTYLTVPHWIKNR